MKATVDSQVSAWNKVADQVHFTVPIDIAWLTSNISSNTRILDYGCGYGRIGRMLADAGFLLVTGYDTSAGMIARGQAENPDLTLLRSDDAVLPDDSASFGVAIAAAVLTCLPDARDREAVIREIGRVLRPEGTLLLSEFLRDDRKSYDENGCFLSDAGIQMKHFLLAELEHELRDWNIQDYRLSKTLSLGGEEVPYVRIRCNRAVGRSAGAA